MCCISIREAQIPLWPNCFRSKYVSFLDLELMIKNISLVLGSRRKEEEPKEEEDEGKCENQMKSCYAWAQAGYCDSQAYSSYMHKHCCIACLGKIFFILGIY